MSKLTVPPFTKPRNTQLAHRPLAVILRDFLHIHEQPTMASAVVEAVACVKCALPLCRSAEVGGCPLGNPINKWHQLMEQGRLLDAAPELFNSNPFPEFMNACPAPCEDVCTAGHHFQSIGIKQTEQALFAFALEHGLITAPIPTVELGITVAIIGSGPAGLAAAWLLRQAGFAVHVLEASSQIGGLLVEGIPEFHLEKHLVDRRVNWMREAGINFHCGVRVGDAAHPVEVKAECIRIGLHTAEESCLECHHLLLALGANTPRELAADFPGVKLSGVHQALDFLIAQNRVQRGLLASHPISVAGENVLVIGGGLTGLDVRSTALRLNNGASGDFVPLTVVRKPCPTPPEQQPHWLAPLDARIEVVQFNEGGETKWGATPIAFLDRETPGAISHVQLRLDDGSVTEVAATRVFLALGFFGPGRDSNGLVAQLGVTTDDSGFIITEGQIGATSTPRVHAIGDCTTHRQKLIVDAVAAGRNAARAMIALYC